jgi:hypothetical protein
MDTKCVQRKRNSPGVFVWSPSGFSYSTPKVKSLDCCLIEQVGIIDLKILSYSRAVKGNFACSNWFHFLAKVEHLHLKCCILGENPENKSTRKYYSVGHPLKIPKQAIIGSQIYGFVPKRLKISNDNCWGHTSYLTISKGVLFGPAY